MSESMFDPNQFLNMTVEEANSTEFIPVPVGDFAAQVDKVELRPWAKKDDPSVAGLALDLTWDIQDASVKELMGRDKVTVKQSIMLDLTESGGLDMGKGRNVGLGRVRAATGLNAPGQPFSFLMLQGRMAKVHVAHEIYKGAPMHKIDAVAPLS